jgi:hypothetical protein
MKYSIGTMPHGKLMTSIELYGASVPMVRERWRDVQPRTLKRALYGD